MFAMLPDRRIVPCPIFTVRTPTTASTGLVSPLHIYTHPSHPPPLFVFSMKPMLPNDISLSLLCLHRSHLTHSVNNDIWSSQVGGPKLWTPSQINETMGSEYPLVVGHRQLSVSDSGGRFRTQVTQTNTMCSPLSISVYPPHQRHI